MKKKEMGGKRGTYGRHDMHTGPPWGNMREIVNLGNLGEMG
jgi:hypothetical protein